MTWLNTHVTDGAKHVHLLGTPGRSYSIQRLNQSHAGCNRKMPWQRLKDIGQMTEPGYGICDGPSPSMIQKAVTPVWMT
jgi:hypothetical protein